MSEKPRDELDAFMRYLESIGVISGWSEFMSDETKEGEEE